MNQKILVDLIRCPVALAFLRSWAASPGAAGRFTAPQLIAIESAVPDRLSAAELAARVDIAARWCAGTAAPRMVELLARELRRDRSVSKNLTTLARELRREGEWALRDLFNRGIGDAISAAWSHGYEVSLAGHDTGCVVSDAKAASEAAAELDDLVEERPSNRTAALRLAEYAGDAAGRVAGTVTSGTWLSAEVAALLTQLARVARARAAA